MSKQGRVEISCPACDTRQYTSYWESVTGNKDPHLKQMIFERTIFDARCENCNGTIRVSYPFLYNDPSRKLAAWLFPNGVDEKSQDAMDSFGMMMPKEFRLRIAYELNELIETIIIFESGFNDWYIHMVKLFLLAEKSGSPTKDIYFKGVENEPRGDIKFNFYLADKDQVASLNGIETPQQTSMQWDQLEPQFDWVYVNDENFYRAMESFQRQFNL